MTTNKYDSSDDEELNKSTQLNDIITKQRYKKWKDMQNGKLATTYERFTTKYELCIEHPFAETITDLEVITVVGTKSFTNFEYIPYLRNKHVVFVRPDGTAVVSSKDIDWNFYLSIDYKGSKINPDYTAKCVCGKNHIHNFSIFKIKSLGDHFVAGVCCCDKVLFMNDEEVFPIGLEYKSEKASLSKVKRDITAQLKNYIKTECVYGPNKNLSLFDAFDLIKTEMKDMGIKVY